MIIQYYKMRFRLASPLSLGSGETAHTDSDVILDSRGIPMIPATAFAGVIRHECEALYGNLDRLFGNIDGNRSVPSKIRFYDAVAESDHNALVTVRDMVALKNKVARNGAKFDREAVETGADFVTLFELRDVAAEDSAMILNALSAMNAGQLRLGSKTSRGYGQIQITEFKHAVFDLPADKSIWLQFDPYDLSSDAFYTAVTLPAFQSRCLSIRLKLQQKGAVSIRTYTARNGKDIQDADYEQMRLSDDTPVIPGTSWAGAFRERFRDLSADETLTRELFGFVAEKPSDDEPVPQQKSRISFSETKLTDYSSKIITRNSIDRFSAATRDGALYTEKTVYNGKCTLEIIMRKDVSDFERAKALLIAVICDLHRGYLAVGGLTAVGRGLFSVQDILIDGVSAKSLLPEGGVC